MKWYATVPCTEALPALFYELVRQRAEWPDKQILLTTTDAHNAYCNVRFAANHTQKICFVVGDALVADFRLTFGRAGSTGYWGLIASALEHAHCKINVENAKLQSK